jgi:hypothetical protein
MATVVRDLGSDDFQTRERAQKLLERVGVWGKQELRELAEKQSDPEVQSRLMERVNALEEIEATDPPRITLDIRDMALTRVTEGLTRAVGMPIRFVGANDAYSVKVEGATFPEVMQLLNQQHPLWINTIAGSGPTLTRVTGVWERSVAWRGFGIFLRDGALPAPAGTAKVAGAPSLIVGAVADPRMKLVRFDPPVVDLVVDDLRHAWMAMPAGNSTGSLLNGRQASTSQTVRLLRADGPAKRLALVEGHLNAAVAVEEESISVEKPGEQLRKANRVGPKEVIIQEFTVAAGPGATKRLRMQVLFRAVGDAPIAAEGQMETTVVVLDADNREVLARGFPPGAGGAAIDQPFGGKEPLKVVITVAKRVRSVVVPFSFRDVRLPG